MAVASRQRLGSGQCGIVVLDNGARLYVSYGTVVGIEHDGAAVFTDRRYSVTTSKQISTHLGRAIGHRYERIPHADFLTRAAAAGLSTHDDRAWSPVDFGK